MKSINLARISRLLTLVTLFVVPAIQADDRPSEAGITAYQDGNYKLAAQSFVRAIRADPQNSSLHHWLGKCYGRLAERGNWFKAMSYAGKTLKQFRKAVELDENNFEALRDLVDYLETAPGFLGGNRQEAKHLGRRLEELQKIRTASNE